MESRPATAAERATVVRIVTGAFATDPVWELALRCADGSTEHHAPYWSLFVDGAMRYGTLTVAPDLGAVAVWLPPGGTELTDDGAAALDALLARSLAPGDIEAIHELYARFEASRAPLAPHMYLSLLATDPDQRGKGLGQQLLAADLARWDADGIPAYLESTNSGNDHRYARAGFRPIGGFSAVRDDTFISAMWRDAGG